VPAVRSTVPAAGLRGRIDRFVYCHTVESFPIAFCAKLPHVEETGDRDGFLRKRSGA
jgi:hypothetical protein